MGSNLPFLAQQLRRKVREEIGASGSQETLTGSLFATTSVIWNSALGNLSRQGSPQREVDLSDHTLRSASAFTVAERTSTQSAAFDIVSIVPSINNASIALPTTTTAARAV